MSLPSLHDIAACLQVCAYMVVLIAAVVVTVLAIDAWVTDQRRKERS